jgi:serine/threonine protein kinase
MREGALVSGRFSLEAEVGAGGGGRVFRARDLLDGAPVAVKCMSQLDAWGLARFTREAVLLARLSHPGLLRYLAHGTAEDGTPWLATEWLEGEDLRHHHYPWRK